MGYVKYDRMRFGDWVKGIREDRRKRRPNVTLGVENVLFRRICSLKLIFLNGIKQGERDVGLALNFRGT